MLWSSLSTNVQRGFVWVRETGGVWRGQCINDQRSLVVLVRAKHIGQHTDTLVVMFVYLNPCLTCTVQHGVTNSNGNQQQQQSLEMEPGERSKG